MPGGVVTTIRDKCKRCYTCIRSCPAKAIKVEDGQAVVVEALCIGCGNCVKVCAQSAKAIESSVVEVNALLASGEPVIACLAPSFPAAFHKLQPGQVIEALRRLGFDEVLEVAVGAELAAREYAELASDRESGPWIATACPAVVSYVQRHLPSLVPYLAPVVSPMIALGRAIKERYRPGARVVFIGPCTAKKAEIREPSVAGAVDAVLTFAELQQMFESGRVAPESLPESDFDGPRPGVGRIFPVSGGLLRTAGLRDDVLNNQVVVTEGVERVPVILREMEDGYLQARFYDLLLCNGCIDGPLMGNELSPFARKEIIANYTLSRTRTEPREREWKLSDFEGLNLRRTYADEHVALPSPSEEEIRQILLQINKTTKADELNCGACGYETCREQAEAIGKGLAEWEMCHPLQHRLLTRLVDRLRELSTTDGLTGLINHRTFTERLEAELLRVERYSTLVSVLMVDVDLFKHVNDSLGHVCGDQVLVAIGRTISESVRGSDIVSRWGGDEFGVILPETDKTQAFAVAEKLRAMIEGTSISVDCPGNESDLNMTVSIGIATSDGPKTGDAIVTEADRALYLAKSRGRNRVELGVSSEQGIWIEQPEEA